MDTSDTNRDDSTDDGESFTDRLKSLKTNMSDKLNRAIDDAKEKKRNVDKKPKSPETHHMDELDPTVNQVHSRVDMTDEYVTIVVDLPNVDGEDVDVNAKPTHIDVRTFTSHTHHYDEEIPLPAPVKIETGQAVFNNGVLEVTFEKEPAPTPDNSQSL